MRRSSSYTFGKWWWEYSDEEEQKDLNKSLPIPEINIPPLVPVQRIQTDVSETSSESQDVTPRSYSPPSGDIADDEYEHEEEVSSSSESDVEEEVDEVDPDTVLPVPSDDEDIQRSVREISDEPPLPENTDPNYDGDFKNYQVQINGHDVSAYIEESEDDCSLSFTDRIRFIKNNLCYFWNMIRPLIIEEYERNFRYSRDDFHDDHEKILYIKGHHRDFFEKCKLKQIYLLAFK